ncbi:transposase, partial [Flavobacterium sp.]|uniref:transposase n=1 Tax=Flavobacterium sp. TaxID=239 RepID=UPI003C53E805
RDLSVQEHLSVQDSKVENNQIMFRNEFGEIAHRQFEWLENQYEYVILHSFIIMPNHAHAIIEIDSNTIKDPDIKIKSLSELIGAYKTTSSKFIRRSGLVDFAWHRSFHDHIIRNENSYHRIDDYIITNAARWNVDVFFDQH